MMFVTRIRTIGFLVCLFAGSLTACSSYNQPVTLDDLALPESTPRMYSDAATRKIILAQIVNSISAYETLDGGTVSIDSHPSEQYKHFLHLKKVATEDELVALTDHPPQ